MSESYVVVSVECASTSRVREVIKRQVGAAFLGGPTSHVMGLHIEISDNHGAIEYARQFLEEHGLNDHNPVWSELDARLFPVDVEVKALSGTIGETLKEHVGDNLARLLSWDLGVRTVLSIDNGYVPFGVYQRGSRVRDFARQYASRFASRDWIPRSIAEGAWMDPK